MALFRTLVGLLAAIALTVAPACALSSAPFGAAKAAGHHASATAHCAAGSEEPSEASTALCAFFCGFFIAPAPSLPIADFEPSHYDAFAPPLDGDDVRPPAPPPRA